jgi:hypothetical protein
MRSIAAGDCADSDDLRAIRVRNRRIAETPKKLPPAVSDSTASLAELKPRATDVARRLITHRDSSNFSRRRRDMADAE